MILPCLFEYDANGKQIDRDELQYIDGELASSNSTSYRFDNFNKLRQILTQEGLLINYEYYGDGLRSNKELPCFMAGIENIDNPFRYCGEYYDEETGSIYLRARYYDPVLGRYMQEDSYKGNIADPLSLNVYTYCYNNPIRFFDPSGNVVTDWDKEHLTPEEQKKIEQYTREYIAGNYNAHYKAEEIRNKYRKKGERGTGTVIPLVPK